MKIKARQAAVLFGCLLTSAASAQIDVTWNYNYDRNAQGLFNGNDNGGRWQTLNTSSVTNVIDNGPIGGISALNDYEWQKDVSFHFDVTLGNYSFGDADALFLVVTADTTAPDVANSDWTALYFDPNGTFYAAEYANDPTETHTFTPLLTGSYSKTSTGSGAGTETTFSLDLNESQLATLAAGNGSASWEGFGFPYDNDGDTYGNDSTPYRMGLWANSFLGGNGEGTEGTGGIAGIDGSLGGEGSSGIGAVSTSVNGEGQVTWQINNKERIGVIDLQEDFSNGPIVPEPSSSLLILIAGLGFATRRRR